MIGVRKPFGFGGTDQVAEFFSIPKSTVSKKAKSGEWPSWVIGGKRVFNVDELVALLVQDGGGVETTEVASR